MTSAQAVKDSAYISQFERQNNLQVNTWYTDIDFTIDPRISGRNYVVDLSPNASGHLGVSFGLKKITLFLGVQIPGTQSDVRRYGKTQYIDFSFGYFKNRWGGEIYFRNYEGLFQLPNDSIPVTIRSDSRLTNYGLSVFYVFNHQRFSYRSVFAQGELQKKSSGSVVILVNGNHRSIVSDSSIIPAPINRSEIFNDMVGLRDIGFTTINVRPGYAHNFVTKGGKWFFSPSLFVGAGFGNYEYASAPGSKWGGAVDFDLQAKVSTGYNNRLLFFNVYLMWDRSFNAFGNNLVSLQTAAFGFNIGYRLNSFFGIRWL